MARRFVDARLRILLLPGVRAVARHALTRQIPGAYGFVLARTHRIDEFVRKELEAGATQLVVLGAGYDSRAYRFRELLGKGRAFEVDAAATSARKRKKVRAVLGEVPAHVCYVPVDFERETMEGPLLAAGFDPAQRTVFTWEGVTFYLTAEAVAQVLGLVARRSGPESAIIFDYLFRSLVEGTSRAYGAEKSRAFVRRKGEPFTFGLDEGAVDTFLAGFGLRMESNLSPLDLEKTYLDGYAQRSRVYRVAGFYGITTARVAPGEDQKR